MKKLSYLFVGTALISLLAGCGSQNKLLANQQLNLPVNNQMLIADAPIKNYLPVDRPEYTYSVGIYPQYMTTFTSKVKEFMAKHITKDDIRDFKFGGWTAPDDAQAEIKFYGVGDKVLFETRIIPDLKYFLGSYGGDGNLYDKNENLVKARPITNNLITKKVPVIKPEPKLPWYKKIFN